MGGEWLFAESEPFGARASPAAETGVGATRGAGVNLDGTFPVEGVGVELVERAVVPAPGVRFLEEVGPNFFGGEKLDGVGNPDAREVRMPIQAIARAAGGYFDAGVSAEHRNGLFPLAIRDAGDDFNNEGRQHGAVFVAAEADEPRAGVVHIELAERAVDAEVAGGVHR